MATCYMEGKDGVKKKIKTAVKWMRRAAHHHHEDAMYQYGNICLDILKVRLYYFGRKFERSFETASSALPRRWLLLR